MSPSELMTIIQNAKGDVEKLNRIIDVFDLLTDDIRLIGHSHDTFLPAAREYLRGKTTADYRFQEARVRRARLGGTSRGLYEHQRKTFEEVIHLLCSLIPVPFLRVPQVWIDQLWVSVKNAEIELLHNARKHSGL